MTCAFQDFAFQYDAFQPCFEHRLYSYVSVTEKKLPSQASVSAVPVSLAFARVAISEVAKPNLASVSQVVPMATFARVNITEIGAVYAKVSVTETG